MKFIAVVIATAYCACPACCAPYADGITAMGTVATEGRTIAGPPEWPLGSVVVMDGKRYIVEDRGGAIQGDRIDVYFESHDDALQFGRRRVEVEVYPSGKMDPPPLWAAPPGVAYVR